MLLLTRENYVKSVGGFPANFKPALEDKLQTAVSEWSSVREEASSKNLLGQFSRTVIVV